MSGFFKLLCLFLFPLFALKAEIHLNQFPEKESSQKMFAVIYQGYLKPGRENEYQEAWSKVAQYFIEYRGAIGSLCLLLYLLDFQIVLSEIVLIPAFVLHFQAFQSYVIEFDEFSFILSREFL